LPCIGIITFGLPKAEVMAIDVTIMDATVKEKKKLLVPPLHLDEQTWSPVPLGLLHHCSNGKQ